MKSIYNGGCSREQGLVEEWYKPKGREVAMVVITGGGRASTDSKDRSVLEEESVSNF